MYLSNIRLELIIIHVVICILKDCQKNWFEIDNYWKIILIFIAWFVVAVPHEYTYIKDPSELGNSLDDLEFDYSDLDNMMFADEIVSTPVTTDQTPITTEDAGQATEEAGQTTEEAGQTTEEAGKTTNGKSTNKPATIINKTIRRKEKLVFVIPLFGKNKFLLKWFRHKKNIFSRLFISKSYAKKSLQ